MYSEFQEHFIYQIIWFLFVVELLAAGSLIYSIGAQNTKATLVIVSVNVLMGYGMYKYTLWLKRIKGNKKSARDKAL